MLAGQGRPAQDVDLAALTMDLVRWLIGKALFVHDREHFGPLLVTQRARLMARASRSPRLAGLPAFTARPVRIDRATRTVERVTGPRQRRRRFAFVQNRIHESFSLLDCSISCESFFGARYSLLR